MTSSTVQTASAYSYHQQRGSPCGAICLFRPRANSLWSIWYTLLTTGLLCFLLYTGLMRYPVYAAEIRYPEGRSDLFINAYLILHAVVIGLLTVFLGVGLFKTGNLASDSERLGQSRDVNGRKRVIEMAYGSNGCCRGLRSIWRHAPPLAQTVHLTMTMCLLLAHFFIQTELFRNGIINQNDHVWTMSPLEFIFGPTKVVTIKPASGLSHLHHSPTFNLSNSNRIGLGPSSWALRSVPTPNTIPLRLLPAVTEPSLYGIPMDFGLHVLGLLAFTITYPAVFSRVSKCFSFLFSIQLLVHGIDAICSYLGFALLFRLHQTGRIRALQTIKPFHQFLTPPTLVGVYLASAALSYFSSALMYSYGYGRYCLAVLSSRGQPRVLQPRCEGYLPNGGAICMLVLLVVARAPLFYDQLILTQQVPLHAQIKLLVCIGASVLFLFTWLVLWLILTLRRNWGFKVNDGTLPLPEPGTLLVVTGNNDRYLLTGIEDNGGAKRAAILGLLDRNRAQQLLLQQQQSSDSEVYWLKPDGSREDRPPGQYDSTGRPLLDRTTSGRQRVESGSVQTANSNHPTPILAAPDSATDNDGSQHNQTSEGMIWHGNKQDDVIGGSVGPEYPQVQDNWSRSGGAAAASSISQRHPSGDYRQQQQQQHYYSNYALPPQEHRHPQHYATTNRRMMMARGSGSSARYNNGNNGRTYQNGNGSTYDIMGDNRNSATVNTFGTMPRGFSNADAAMRNAEMYHKRRMESGTQQQQQQQQQQPQFQPGPTEEYASVQKQHQHQSSAKPNTTVFTSSQQEYYASSKPVGNYAALPQPSNQISPTANKIGPEFPPTPSGGPASVSRNSSYSNVPSSKHQYSQQSSAYGARYQDQPGPDAIARGGSTEPQGTNSRGRTSTPGSSGHRFHSQDRSSYSPHEMPLHNTRKSPASSRHKNASYAAQHYAATGRPPPFAGGPPHPQAIPVTTYAPAMISNSFGIVESGGSSHPSSKVSSFREPSVGSHDINIAQQQQAEQLQQQQQQQQHDESFNSLSSYPITCAVTSVAYKDSHTRTPSEKRRQQQQPPMQQQPQQLSTFNSPKNVGYYHSASHKGSETSSNRSHLSVDSRGVVVPVNPPGASATSSLSDISVPGPGQARGSSVRGSESGLSGTSTATLTPCSPDPTGTEVGSISGMVFTGAEVGYMGLADEPDRITPTPHADIHHRQMVYGSGPGQPATAIATRRSLSTSQDNNGNSGNNVNSQAHNGHNAMNNNPGTTDQHILDDLHMHLAQEDSAHFSFTSSTESNDPTNGQNYVTSIV